MEEGCQKAPPPAQWSPASGPSVFLGTQRGSAELQQKQPQICPLALWCKRSLSFCFPRGSLGFLALLCLCPGNCACNPHQRQEAPLRLGHSLPFGCAGGGHVARNAPGATITISRWGREGGGSPEAPGPRDLFPAPSVLLSIPLTYGQATRPWLLSAAAPAALWESHAWRGPAHSRAVTDVKPVHLTRRP